MARRTWRVHVRVALVVLFGMMAISKQFLLLHKSTITTNDDGSDDLLLRLRPHTSNTTEVASAVTRVNTNCGHNLGGQARTRCVDVSIPPSLHDGPTTRREMGLAPRILFHHVRKTGGTSLCAMSKINGEISPPRAGGEWGCSDPEFPCKADLDMLVSRYSNLTYLEAPCPSHPSWNLPARSSSPHASDWLFVTIARHPVERDLSEYRHFGHNRLAKEVNGTKDALDDDMDLFLEYAKTAINLMSKFYVPNSYDITQEFGEDALLEHAKRHLSSYDVVLILEDMDVDCPRLADALGWNATATCSIHRNSDAARVSNAAQMLGKERLSTALDQNKLDVQLYDYARELAARQREQWRKGRDATQ